MRSEEMNLVVNVLETLYKNVVAEGNKAYATKQKVDRMDKIPIKQRKKSLGLIKEVREWRKDGQILAKTVKEIKREIF